MKEHKQNTARTPAERLYGLFLHLYPREHRHTYGPLMLQAFKDNYRDTRETEGKVGMKFWLDVVSDEAKSIGREHSAALRRSTQKMKKSTFGMMIVGIGLFLALSFFVMGPIALIVIGIVLLVGISFFVKRSSRSDIEPLRGAENIWMQQGLLYGAILGAFLIIWNLMNNLAPVNSSLQNVSWSFAVILFQAILFQIGLPLACGLAGFVSGRKSHTARAGTFAGLFTAVISSAISVGSLMLIMVLFWNIIRYNALHDPNMIGDFHHRGDQTFDQFLWQDNLGGATFSTIFSLLYGVILGTVGGLIGAKTGRVAQ
jgi:hypothetical protein